MQTPTKVDLPVVVYQPDSRPSEEHVPLRPDLNFDSLPASRSRWALTDTQYSKWVKIAALICIAVGVLLRVVHFGSIPRGLNQDEASIGYDAWCLAHFGTEGNGVHWPVHLISWGNGGNASYAYMAAPFVAFALSPFTLRLPMLMASLASLFLVWFVMRRLFDERAAWASAAVVALSPWHIMLSRWALDCNALPFLFLCALALLIASLHANRKFVWLVFASMMFGVTVYSYGPAYLAVPVFMLGALTICVMGGLLTSRQAVAAAAIFAVIALPMALYICVNFFHWKSIHIAGITVPRLPTTPRFQTETALGPLHNLRDLFRLLITQQDGKVYNAIAPYGVVYSGVFLALALGIIGTIAALVVRHKWPLARLLIPLWIIACVPIGIFQEPNVNRLNLLIMGIVSMVGVALATVDKWARGTLIFALAVMLVFSGFFARDYFTVRGNQIAVEFFDGLLPALAYARHNTLEGRRICVTDQVNMPQMYVLFNSPADSEEYRRSVKYINPDGPFRQVASYGNYVFGLQRCDFAKAQVVVVREGEGVPTPFVKSGSFSLFAVYIRR